MVSCRFWPGVASCAFEHLVLAAGDVHDHAPLPVDALQDFVVLALESGLSDQVALRVIGEVGGVQFLLR